MPVTLVLRASVQGVPLATNLPVHCTLFGGVILKLSSMTLAKTEQRRKNLPPQISAILKGTVLSLQYTKERLQEAHQQFYDHMIHEKSLSPNLIAQFGKQDGQRQQRDWHSSQSKLASQCSLTKGLGNTTPALSPLMRIASTNCQAVTLGML